MNRKTLCNDLDEATIAWFLQQRVPEAPRLLLDPYPRPSSPMGCPCTMSGSWPTTTSPRARRTGWSLCFPAPHVHDLDTGHLPMLSNPKALAGLLDDIANEETVYG